MCKRYLRANSFGRPTVDWWWWRWRRLRRRRRRGWTMHAEIPEKCLDRSKSKFTTPWILLLLFLALGTILSRMVRYWSMAGEIYGFMSFEECRKFSRLTYDPFRAISARLYAHFRFYDVKLTLLAWRMPTDQRCSNSKSLWLELCPCNSIKRMSQKSPRRCFCNLDFKVISSRGL